MARARIWLVRREPIVNKWIRNKQRIRANTPSSKWPRTISKKTWGNPKIKSLDLRSWIEILLYRNANVRQRASLLLTSTEEVKLVCHKNLQHTDEGAREELEMVIIQMMNSTSPCPNLYGMKRSSHLLKQWIKCAVNFARILILIRSVW